LQNALSLLRSYSALSEMQHRAWAT